MMRPRRLILLTSFGVACASSAHLDIGPVPSSVTANARIDYYDVTASNLAELRQGMRLQGPMIDGRRWTAQTHWQLRWTWTTDPRSVGGCSLRKVHVYIETVVTFPRWQPTAAPDSAMQAWWEQMNVGLVEHERGHALLAVKAAGDIARELEGMSGGSCEGLAVRANTLGQARVREMNMRQVVYDDTTRHGAIQIQRAVRLREP